MKKIILWLARLFKVELPVKQVIKEIEKEVYVYDGAVVEGTLRVKGDMLVKGRVLCEGDITIFSK